ncbi:MAG TPA: hypothetical protein VIT92_08360 [Burkholderiaceae bacterium]
MQDHEFLAAFQDCTLPAGSFTHAAHVRAAYCFLRTQPFLEACIAMRDGLRNYAASLGKSMLYHETVTVAFMAIVADRMARSPALDWSGLLAAYPELSDRGLLDRYYDAELLATEQARACFALPLREVAHG